MRNDIVELATRTQLFRQEFCRQRMRMLFIVLGGLLLARVSATLLSAPSDTSVGLGLAAIIVGGSALVTQVFKVMDAFADRLR